MKRDNSTEPEKAALRQAALAKLEAPVVLETHGGFGSMFRRCYSAVHFGVVFETDDAKAERLAIQRPTWRVYQADCAEAIANGAVTEVGINFVDIDPYGDPWPTIKAVLSSGVVAEQGWLVVNDGLRMKANLDSSNVGSLAPAVAMFGAQIGGQYLSVCQWLMETEAEQAGYRLLRFGGYYCGHAKNMTHYAAQIARAN